MFIHSPTIYSRPIKIPADGTLVITDKLLRIYLIYGKVMRDVNGDIWTDLDVE